MKKIIISLISIFSFTVFASDVAEISRDELLASKTPEWLILDVRTVKEYNQGHVPGAVNLSHDQIADQIEKLLPRKDKPIVVYCRSGYRAGKAAEILIDNGFTQVKHLTGDMLGWQEAGLDIEK